MNKRKKDNIIRSNKAIPEFFFPLFWEYDPGTIDTAKHAGLIIERIMARGSWASMVWLQKTYNKDQRTLPFRELNYWASICGIPPEKRQNWLMHASESSHVWRARHAH